MTTNLRTTALSIPLLVLMAGLTLAQEQKPGQELVFPNVDQVRSRPSVGDGGEHCRDAVVHEQVGSVASVMGQRLDLDQVTGRHDHCRGQSRVEEAPVHRRRRGRQEGVYGNKPGQRELQRGVLHVQRNTLVQL